MDYRKKYIECMCGTNEHTIRYSFFDDNEDLSDHIFYIDVYLESTKWYKRIWRGIKYIFGYKSRYADFTEVIYNTDKVKELKTFLDEYLKATPKKENNDKLKLFEIMKKLPPEAREDIYNFAMKKSESKIPWTWYEDTSGWPVYLLEEYKTGKCDPARILAIGIEIALMTFGGYASATITDRDPNGDYIAENEGSIFPISFNGEKGYWVCSMGMNKKAIKIVEKTITKKGS